MSLIDEIHEKENMSHKTEEKLIGWILMEPEKSETYELAKMVNPKNLSVFGRVVLKKMIEIMDRFPESAHYGKMQGVAFVFAVKEMNIPYSYIFACIEASSCWVPHGPTEIEIKELTI